MTSKSPIIAQAALGSPPWPTLDPFLFCVHHLDTYPVGNEAMGPAASLAGRDIGQDFAGKDGWRMYHGDKIPGFPQHPHRGFETITVMRSGLVDHSDSLGATARFGPGDVQWMTAGKGIVHSEMFPLVNREQPNPLELFQIWINLPKAKKFVEPYFSMLWADQIPVLNAQDADGRNISVTIVAGALGEKTAPKPPPDSWAASEDHDVAVWTLVMEPNAKWQLPAAKGDTLRTLYFFKGSTLSLGGEIVRVGHVIQVDASQSIELVNGDSQADILLLQGRPIDEPVVSYGPFVMNSKAEIQQAYTDYQRTKFGGWPWKSNGPVHSREEGRFAKHVDGRVERR